MLRNGSSRRAVCAGPIAIEAAPVLRFGQKLPLVRRIATVCVFVLLAMVAASLYFTRTGTRHTGTPEQAPSLDGLSLRAEGEISSALGNDEMAYRIDRSSAGFSAMNPAQQTHMNFDRFGASIGSGVGQWAVRLRAISDGRSRVTIGGATPQARANEVMYHRGDVDEWLTNGPFGVEQGFTVARPLAHHGTGELQLTISLPRQLHARLYDHGQDLGGVGETVGETR